MRKVNPACPIPFGCKATAMAGCHVEGESVVVDNTKAAAKVIFVDDLGEYHVEFWTGVGWVYG